MTYYDICGEQARRVGWFDALDQSMRFEAVRSLVRPGDRVVDVGCGLGALSHFLDDLQIDYLGLDIWQPFLDEAKLSANGTFRLFDFMNEPLPDADVFVAIGSGIGNDGQNELQSLIAQMKSKTSRDWIVIGATDRSPAALTIDASYSAMSEESGIPFTTYENVASSRPVPAARDCLDSLLAREPWCRAHPNTIARAYLMAGAPEKTDALLAACDPQIREILEDRLAMIRGISALCEKYE